MKMKKGNIIAASVAAAVLGVGIGVPTTLQWMNAKREMQPAPSRNRYAMELALAQELPLEHFYKSATLIGYTMACGNKHAGKQMFRLFLAARLACEMGRPYPCPSVEEIEKRAQLASLAIYTTVAENPESAGETCRLALTPLTGAHAGVLAEEEEIEWMKGLKEHYEDSNTLVKLPDGWVREQKEAIDRM